MKLLILCYLSGSGCQTVYINGGDGYFQVWFVYRGGYDFWMPALVAVKLLWRVSWSKSQCAWMLGANTRALVAVLKSAYSSQCLWLDKIRERIDGVPKQRENWWRSEKQWENIAPASISVVGVSICVEHIYPSMCWRFWGFFIFWWRFPQLEWIYWAEMLAAWWIGLRLFFLSWFECIGLRLFFLSWSELVECVVTDSERFRRETVYVVWRTL